jgi:cytochrome c-type biogenesis protein CcmF
MNGLVGHIGILLGLLSCAAGVAEVLTGLIARRPGLLDRSRRFVYLALLGTLVSVGAMEHALLTHDFSLAYVAANNSRQTPLLYDVTGLWSALQGSLLLWVLILTGYVSFVAWRFKERTKDPMVAIALVVALVIAGFFFALMIGPADPFSATRGPIPANGAGPNSLLQDNTLVAFHPVFLYLGYVGFTIPFAFAVASLVTGRVGEGWLVQTRRFAVVAWAFLTVGIVAGAWWSYQVTGWGGFWGWDPVENAALMPWLTGTAYLHSVMVQERRGLLRIWNLSLLVATFALTILGTFLTRSGIVQSEHAFSASGLGPALIGLFAAVVATGVGLIAWRGDRLSSAGGIDQAISREGAFVVNNLLFAGFALVVLVGTVFPLFAQAINGQAITIGRPFFDSFSVPIGLALLFFMAIAPALPWRAAAPGVVRQRLVVPLWTAVGTLAILVAAGVRGLTPLAAFGLGAFAASAALRQLILAARASRRRGLSAWRGIVGRANGGMVSHIGIVVIAVGLSAATSFGHSASLTLRVGERVRFDGHLLQLMAVSPFHEPSRSGLEAVVRVDHGTFRPAIDVFRGDSSAVSTPSVDSGLVDDVYLAPGGGFTPSSAGHLGSATLDVFVQPLVVWLWVGGALTAAGAVLAILPGRRRRATDPVGAVIPELAEEVREMVGARR